ncbi:MAG TPA: HlyD family efflux transporter periplasmic adaptor subunit [Planctomycetaceae bacterium]
MTRVLLGTTALAGLAALLLGPAVGQDQAARKAAATESPDPLSTVVVAQDAQVKLDEEAVLASDRPGILAFVEPEEGDRVTAGQQVAKLKDEVAAAALAVAEKTAESDIEVRYAEKAAAVADAEYRKNLEGNRMAKQYRLSADLVTEIDLERLRLAAERAQLQIEKAEVDREIAKLTAEEKAAELKTFRIVAPIDGIVTEVNKQAGEAVQQGDPILRVVRTDVVRVEGFVTVPDAFRVKPGDAVRVRLDAENIPGLPPELADRVFEGKVSFVAPTAELLANKVRVWATVPNDRNLLRAGLPAAMEIVPSGDLAAAFGPEASK